MSKKTTKIRQTYQLKITLQRSKPPIWRRVLVASDTKLSELHNIILNAMGWYGYHLHQFTIGDTYYGQKVDDPMFGWELEVKDERRYKLNDLVSQEKAKFRYEYDFGDDWVHIITLEKILPYDPKQKLPVCIKGKGACPPEDCGGVWGYYSLLEALKDPENPDHDDMLEWVGGEFDPEAFDLDVVNKRL